MPVLSRDNAPTFNLPGICFTTLSSPSRGARENAVWEVTIAPGVSGAPHRLTREETFVALSGSAMVELDGQRFDLVAGSTLVVDAGQILSVSNVGTEPFRALAVLPVGGQAVVGDRPAFTPPWAA
ncbi:cupin domain-containing protein [Luteitalea sp. TBR-22]|uniref:cupin domain-containing protein n=1 Tax=Luteitalea sp. TBR-22 TaxID=2802971 RepID=UPI001EF65CAC|nr:cupin domain-containing protein [Luteitalea sp. TBR-22]